jgi:hypothetical protein
MCRWDTTNAYEYFSRNTWYNLVCLEHRGEWNKASCIFSEFVKVNIVNDQDRITSWTWTHIFSFAIRRIYRLNPFRVLTLRLSVSVPSALGSGSLAGTSSRKWCRINPSKYEAYLRNISVSSSYLKEGTARIHGNDQLVNNVRDIIAV